MTLVVDAETLTRVVRRNASAIGIALMAMTLHLLSSSLRITLRGFDVCVVPLPVQIGEMAHDTVFLLCCFLLTVATLCQHRLFVLASANLKPSRE